MSIDTRSITHERPIAVNAISQCKREEDGSLPCCMALTSARQAPAGLVAARQGRWPRSGDATASALTADVGPTESGKRPR